MRRVQLVFIIYDVAQFRNTFPPAGGGKGPLKKKVIFLKFKLAFSNYFWYYIRRACDRARNTQQQGGATDG